LAGASEGGKVKVHGRRRAAAAGAKRSLRRWIRGAIGANLLILRRIWASEGTVRGDGFT
jgi:hypothetical protein